MKLPFKVFLSTFLVCCALSSISQVDYNALLTAANEKKVYYRTQGQMDSALFYADSCIRLCETYQPDYIGAIANLESDKVHILLYLGTIDSAAAYLDSVLEKYKSGERKEEDWEGVFHMLKGEVYFANHDHPRALKTMRTAIAKLHKVEPEDDQGIFDKSRYLSVAYGEMGNNFYRMEMYDSSIVYQLLSLKGQDTTTLHYAREMVNLSIIHTRIDRCEEAVMYMGKAEECFSNLEVAITEKVLFNTMQSRVRSTCGNYKEAIRYGKIARSYYDELSDNFFRFNMFYRFLASSYLRTGNIQEAESACKDWIPLVKSDIIIESSFLSSANKIDYLDWKIMPLSESLSAIKLSDTQSPEFNKQVYEFAAFIKNYPLKSLDQLSELLKGCKDSSIIKYHDEWRVKRKWYYENSRFVAKEDKNKFDSLRTEIQDMENVLYRKLGSENKRQNFDGKKFENIAKALGPNDVCIELVRYFDLASDKYSYGAFVFDKESKYPKFIELCTADTLASVLARKSLESEFKYIARLTQDGALYDLVWSKMADVIKEKSNLYISNAGHFNSISHEAVKLPNGTTLFDRHNVVIVNSTSDLEQAKSLSFDAGTMSATLFGGVQYQLASDYQLASGASVLNEFRGQMEGSWNYLKYSEDEIEEIKELIVSKGGNVRLFSGIDASESAFKNYVDTTSSNIVHISTHGLYHQDTTASSYVLDSKTYLRSGLIMAGANTCNQEQSPIVGFGDGVVTAPEVSLLNMSGTNLVVLSACESGLGTTSSTGNTYGLQRAFKTAGVDYVIYSLWKVSDEVTKEFMLSFYKKLANGVEVQTAFYKTKKEMRAKRSAFYWAPFQLVM